MTKIVDLALNGSLVDTKSGATGTFNRASVGWAMDANNVLQEYAVDAPRFTANGLLLEAAGANVCLQSRNLTADEWVSSIPSTPTQTETGIDGVANTAWSMIDAVGDNSHRQYIDIPSDANTHTVSIFIKRNTLQTIGTALQINLVGTATTWYRATYDHSAGTVAAQGDATGSVDVVHYGDWARISVTITNDNTDKDELRLVLYPNKDSGEMTIPIVVDQAQVELNQSYATSPIITLGLGSELITNGDFSADSDWAKGDGWTISGGSASRSIGILTNSELKQSGIISDTDFTTLYKLVFTCTEVSGSSWIRVWLGDKGWSPTNPNSATAEITESGTYTSYLQLGEDTSGIDQTRIVIAVSGSAADVAWDVSNISLKKVSTGLVPILAETLGDETVTNGTFDADTDWDKTAGWTIAGGVADCDGTQVVNTNINQASVTSGVSTDLYKVTMTLLNWTAGNIQVYLGVGGWDTAGSASPWLSDRVDGTYTFYLSPTTTVNDPSRLFITGNTSFVGQVDNVTIKKVLNHSQGTLVVDWTPGASADIDTVDLGMISVDADNALSIFRNDAADNVFKASDGTTVAQLTEDWAINTPVRLAVRWGVNTSTYVSQLQVSKVVSGTITNGTAVAYDGAFVLDTLLQLMVSGTWPQAMERLQFYDELLTDAQLESPNLGIPGNGIGLTKGFIGE